ncbi:MAG TPA: DUF4175 family protein, partial [Alphaproteobacteria bacterium]|nr:DUF4175 family protein [Alphaproteobacteria bacterium]
DTELAQPDAATVERVSFEDLTSNPWAGLPVQMKLIATDAAGHKAETAPVDIVLPERVFYNPIARALIEERKKILENPDDDTVRNEVANVMAGIAHQPSSYRGDPVVLMALRSGAVRLVLEHGRDALEPTASTLWQSAVRIEDGTTGLAEQQLRAAQKELADALDRNASDQEIQALVSKLHQALAQYLQELSARQAGRPGPTQDLSQLLGSQVNMLTPKDFDQMLEQIQSLSATGSRDAARAELQKMQQMLENIQTGRPQFTEEQERAMQQLINLRALVQAQQKLLDKTYQNAQGSDKTPRGKLAGEQNDLLRQLQGMMGKTEGATANSLAQGEGAMKGASGDLQQGEAGNAVKQQEHALADLQQAMQDMAENLRQSLMMLPMPGMGHGMAGNDPFGRNGNLVDDQGVKVPDRMEVRKVREILDELQRRAGDMGRPKAERDYIERLLQNF